MEVVCPICNGLQSMVISCPGCHTLMVDGGILEDYFGPYSPYSEHADDEGSSLGEQCVHLLYCPQCHYDTRIAWELIHI